MVKSTYFLQDCPVCGRKLEVRVEYLGRQVTCCHCGGQLVAQERDSSPASLCLDTRQDLMRRAEALLGRAPGVRRQQCLAPAVLAAN